MGGGKRGSGRRPSRAGFSQSHRKEITVSGKFPTEQETRFELYNTSGILLVAHVIPAGEVDARVSLPDLPSGLYYYSILMDSAAVSRGKLMVQH